MPETKFFQDPVYKNKKIEKKNIYQISEQDRTEENKEVVSNQTKENFTSSDVSQ